MSRSDSSFDSGASSGWVASMPPPSSVSGVVSNATASRITPLAVTLTGCFSSSSTYAVAMPARSASCFGLSPSARRRQATRRPTSPGSGIRAAFRHRLERTLQPVVVRGGEPVHDVDHAVDRLGEAYRDVDHAAALDDAGQRHDAVA